VSTGPAAATGLGRSSSVMAVGTAVSRLTGFARSVAIVAALGLFVRGDAFSLANTIPNNLYILVAGGALNAVFIPQLVRAMRRDDDGGVLFAQRLLTMTVALLLVVTVVTVVAAPELVGLFASSRLQSPQYRPYLDSSISYARWCLPQIVFYGLFVIVGQILNARGRFGPMMFAPIVNNLVAIAVFGTFIALHVPDRGGAVPFWQVLLLGGGSTLGVVAQAAVLVPTLRRAGVPLRPRLGWREVGLGRVGRLAGWTLLFVTVNQIAYVVVSRVTTGINAGAGAGGRGGSGVGFTAYQNAFLVFQLPHAVVAVSLVTALLPRLSRSAAAGARDEVARDLTAALRVLLAVTLPAAALFAVLGRDVAVTLFSLPTGGRTPVAEAAVIGDVLSAFGLATLVFSCQYLFLRGFYAFEDTRTPFLLQVVIAAVNAGGAEFGYHLLAGHGPVAQLVSVAVSYGLAYLVGAGLSGWVLGRRLGGLRLVRTVGPTVARAGGAAVAAAIAAGVVDRLLAGAIPDTAWAAALRLVIAGTVLLLGYVALARRLGVAEIDSATRMVAGRLRRRRRDPG
jgi:putative peptidoglycan lipid II flippase